MKPIIIAELETLSDIETAIVAINANAGAALQVSKNSVNKRKGAMHDASRLQLLVTWARATENPYLHFHTANNLESVIAELCGYAPGITALRLSEGVKIGDQVVTRRVALQGAADKMKNTDDLELLKIIKGRSIDMTSVSGAQRQYLRPLFSERSSKAVKDAEGMYSLLQELNDKINQTDKNLVPESFLKACSIFTSELFENTQEHATHDQVGAPYSAHVEGFIISWLQMDEDQFISDFQGHEKLKYFWNREVKLSRNSSKKSLRCLQLSFFDSGPGFASRATGMETNQLDRLQEREKLLACLQKNFTTKKQTGAGQGLPGVLTALNEIGGLIRIRSGRHSIFNCFEPNKEANIFEFEDWTDQPLAAVAGSVISLIVPLRK